MSDPKSMAEGLNDYFVSILLTLAAEYKEESCNIAQTTNDNISSFLFAQFKFSPIPVDNVALPLRGLKANIATTLDKIPPKTLKLSASIVAPPLTYIFNLSLVTGITKMIGNAHVLRRFSNLEPEGNVQTIVPFLSYQLWEKVLKRKSSVRYMVT